MYNGPAGNFQDNKYYRWIKNLNMVFFFLFRFSALIYISYALWRDYYQVPNLAIYLFLSLAVLVILFLSVLLFFRVFKSDFMTPDPQTDKTFQAIKEGLNSTEKLSNRASLDNKASGDAIIAAKKILSLSSSTSSASLVS